MKCSPDQPDTCPLIKFGGACVGWTLDKAADALDEEWWADTVVGETNWECNDRYTVEFLETLDASSVG